jgi:hypothetical protein
VLVPRAIKTLKRRSFRQSKCPIRLLRTVKWLDDSRNEKSVEAHNHERKKTCKLLRYPELFQFEAPSNIWKFVDDYKFDEKKNQNKARQPNGDQKLKVVLIPERNFDSTFRREQFNVDILPFSCKIRRQLKILTKIE